MPRASARSVRHHAFVLLHRGAGSVRDRGGRVSLDACPPLPCSALAALRRSRLAPVALAFVPGGEELLPSRRADPPLRWYPPTREESGRHGETPQARSLVLHRSWVVAGPWSWGCRGRAGCLSVGSHQRRDGKRLSRRSWGDRRGSQGKGGDGERLPGEPPRKPPEAWGWAGRAAGSGGVRD